MARAMANETVRAETDAAERAWFRCLYRDLAGPVYGFIRFRVGDADVAEDLTAQVFEQVLRRLSTVRDPERVRAWIFAIARTTVGQYRRRRRPVTDLAAVEHLAHLHIASPEDAAIRDDEWRRLVGYLAELPEREREVIGLRFAAGLGNEEIGRILGLSPGNVAQIVHRTVVKLRRRFLAEETGP